MSIDLVGRNPQPDTPPYQYSRLTSNDSIRLVGLLKSDLSSTILCVLAEFQFHSATKSPPKYRALSYTWGDGTKSNAIKICDLSWGEQQGRPILLPDPSPVSVLRITENLYRALLHVAPSESGQLDWFYIDALCINQQSEEEKSQQVAIMAKIFSDASEVRAWLGLADEASSKAFDWLEAQVSRVQAHYEGKPEPAELLPPDIEMTSENYKAFMATFTSSEDRKWWERRWVIQEVSLAQDVTLQCGSRLLSWRYLAIVCCIIQHAIKAKTRSDTFENGLLHMPNIEMYDNIVLANATKCICDMRGINNEEPLLHSPHGWSPLLLTLRKFYSYKFSNPYDAVYAVLAMCKFEKYSIAPDYPKPLLDVCIDAVEVMLLDTCNLNALCLQPLRLPDGKNNLKEVIDDCPSWIPVQPFRKRANLPQDHNGGLLVEVLKYFSADAGGSLSSDFLSQNRRCLKLEGFLVDSIQKFLPQASQGSGNITLEVQGVPHDSYHVKESYLKTLCCDCTWNLHGPALRRMSPSDYRRCEIAMNAGLLMVDAADPNYIDEHHCHFRKATDISDCADWLLPTLYQQSFARLCTTREGRYAWVRADAMEGDLLAIVLGSRAPVTLRRAQRENHFVFLGTAYVSDIMDGQLLKEPGAAEKIRSIILE